MNRRAVFDLSATVSLQDNSIPAVEKACSGGSGPCPDSLPSRPPQHQPEAFGQGPNPQQPSSRAGGSGPSPDALRHPFGSVKSRTVAALAALLCLGSAVFSTPLAAVCPAGNTRVAPDFRYSVSEPVAGQRVVTDLKTGLMWKQCTEGQSGATCASGAPTDLSWSAALITANGSTHAGFSDWRVPNANELRSLAETACHFPAINETIFPATSPSAAFWSSTTFVANPAQAWVISAEDGNLYNTAKVNQPYVRLVRGGQVFDGFNSGADFTPDAFTFTAQTGVPQNDLRTSNTITVSGINMPVGISISGAASSEYRVNSGPYTTNPGTVQNGDTVTVRHTSAGAPGSTVTSTVTVGASVAAFSTTTEFIAEPTTSTITADTPDPSMIGQLILVDVSVSGTTTQPASGQVTLTSSSGESCTDTTVTPGSGTSSLYSCTMSLTTTGTRALVATYTGSITHAASSSAPELHYVLPPPRPLNDTGQVACDDNSATAGTVSGTTPDPEPPGFNEQDCTQGRSAANAVGALVKAGASTAYGRDYTKIANNGSELPANAVLGSGSLDWACTRDNVTGLIWEVKVSAPTQLRHAGHVYSWFESNASINGGNSGSVGGNTCNGTLPPSNQCNTTAYRDAVNAIPGGLCGAADWRLPNLGELQSLTHFGAASPAIDSIWLPNTDPGIYWALETYAPDLSKAWSIRGVGDVETYFKVNANHIRLVRGGQ